MHDVQNRIEDLPDIILGLAACSLLLRKISGYEFPLLIAQVGLISLLFFTGELRLSFLAKK